MPPIMFHYNRAYMTPEQYSLTVKSLTSTYLPQTCCQKCAYALFSAEMLYETSS